MKVPESYYDEIFKFRGQWEIPSECGLKIIDKDGETIVVVTELYQDNPGTSVAEAGELLFAQVCEAKGLNPEKIMYVECNPDTHSKLSFYDEEYFEVKFRKEDGKWGNPTYRQLSKEEVQMYIR
jgi:hypothetical protein